MQSIISFFTQSSEDPAKTSATLTGILISLSSWLQSVIAPHIPFLATFYNSPLGQQSEAICTGIGFVIGGIVFLFGLFRKGTNLIEAKFSRPTL